MPGARPHPTGVGRAWRLLLDGSARGPWNMAVDRALLASAAGGGAPTLRFYAWSGPWLSIGYAQGCGAERLAACARAGVGVVRRPTGGSAVLHGGDLTYALAAPEVALSPGLRASYELVAAALLSALRALGVDAVRCAAGADPPGSGRRSFDCFSRPAAHELCAGGLKLVGSAQRRAGGAVLQHGSIRVHPDSPPARRAAGLEVARATSLRELGCDHALETVRDACVSAFGEALGASFRPGRLTPQERLRAEGGQRDPAEAAPDLRLPSPRGSQG